MTHRNILLLLVAFLLHTPLCSLRADAQELNMQSYVKYGEQYLGKPWAEVSVASFAKYFEEGNRVEYEGQLFARRRQFAALVMAEVAEGKGRFMKDIVVGVDSMIAEKWWGLPAHYRNMEPRYDDQTVDLFNAESASLLAWTDKTLHAKLEAQRKGITDSIAKEINHRILSSALGAKYWWKKAAMNWNTWIISNWLECVYLYEKDATKRQQAVTEIEGCMRAFIDGYPNDGGCDEGCGYWDRAAASLFECFYFMKKIQAEGLANVTILDYQKDKVARMGAYIYNMYIGNGYCVTFADTHENRSMVQLNVLYPFALYLNDPQMRSLAAFIAKDRDFWQNPAALYDKSGNFPTLGRELMLLQNIDALKAEKPSEPTNSAWYPDLQIKTFRYSAGNGKGLFCAFKGGNNAENHNHNDVGSMVVYYDGEPLFIDCGTGEYTDKTFSKERYDIWTMQTAYHNAPLVNGYNQKEGKQFAATVVKETPTSLTLDLTKAYPADADANLWQRTVEVKKDEITLTEEFDLNSYKASSRLIFVTPVKPDTSKPGRVKLGNHTITYPMGVMVAGMEDISDKIDPVLRQMWGDKLYRVGIAISANKPKGKVVLKIK